MEKRSCVFFFAYVKEKKKTRIMTGHLSIYSSTKEASEEHRSINLRLVSAEHIKETGVFRELQRSLCQLK